METLVETRELVKEYYTYLFHIPYSIFRIPYSVFRIPCFKDSRLNQVVKSTGKTDSDLIIVHVGTNNLKTSSPQKLSTGILVLGPLTVPSRQFCRLLKSISFTNNNCLGGSNNWLKLISLQTFNAMANFCKHDTAKVKEISNN